MAAERAGAYHARVMPSSARLLARTRRRLGSGVVRLFAVAVALAMVVNALAAAAMPLPASPAAAMLQAPADAPCAHHAPAPAKKPAAGHGIDCPCCLGKTCACGPLIAGFAAPARMPAAVRSPVALPSGDPPPLEAAPVQPMLRPPIA